MKIEPNNDAVRTELASMSEEHGQQISGGAIDTKRELVTVLDVEMHSENALSKIHSGNTHKATSGRSKPATLSAPKTSASRTTGTLESVTLHALPKPEPRESPKTSVDFYKGYQLYKDEAALFYHFVRVRSLWLCTPIPLTNRLLAARRAGVASQARRRISGVRSRVALYSGLA